MPVRTRDVAGRRVDREPDRFDVGAGSPGHADETLGHEHDIVAGEFELSDSARRIVDRPDRPRLQGLSAARVRPTCVEGRPRAGVARRPSRLHR